MNRYVIAAVLTAACLLGVAWEEAKAQTVVSCTDPEPNRQKACSTRWWQTVTTCELSNGDSYTTTRTIPYIKNGCIINGVPYHCWFNQTTKEVRLVVQRYP